MSDHLQTDGPGGPASPREYSAPSSSTAGAEFSSPVVPDSAAIEDLDREVREAMAAMDSADFAELCGQAAPSSCGGLPADSESVAPGTELIGTVVGFSDDEVFLELDAKSQAVLPRNQFGKNEPMELGRRVDVVADRFDRDSGMLQVNRKGAIQRATWTNLSVGMIVEGKVTGLNKGGLEVDLHGIRAFLPGSQVDLHPMRDISVLLGQTIRAEVIELERRNKNILLSRRKVLEREREETRQKLQAELAVGQIRRGVVGNIADFGAFVDLGGVDGLIHIRELSWGTVEKVTDVLSPGQEVEVMVLKIDAKRDRISLGLKQAQPDPWVNVQERYPAGTTCKARVVRLADFGAFAELESGVEGLIPVSEMGWQRVQRVSEAVSPGSVVDVQVIRVEPERRRIALSMKQAQPDPWAGVLESFPEKSVTKGTITRLATFGAFVQLAPGVEGLIHISELSDKHVKTCREVVDAGQEVEVRVLGIDRENRRISLSMKAVHAAEAVAVPVESAKPAKKQRKKPLRGGLSSHWDW